MSILITTVGQRDVQFVDGNNCHPFDKFDLMKIQNKLQAMNKNNIKWVPYINGSDRLQQEGKFIRFNDIENSELINITFPLIEKVLAKVKKDVKNRNPIEKIYLYYTDRHDVFDQIEDEELKKHIKSEPWYFAKMVQKFYAEIIEHYKLDFPEIKIIKIEDSNNEINRKCVIQFFDDHIRKNIELKSFEDFDEKIIVACSGGLPDVKNVIEEVCSLYFPENCFFYDQNQTEDNIQHSQYHEYKKKAKDKYELIERIRAHDFDAAYSIISKPDSLIDRTSNIFNLTKLAHEWLSGDPEKAKNLCIALEEEYKQEHINTFKLMKKMISEKKNSCSRSLVRLLYLYRKKNYWGAATVLITAIENLCIRFISFVFPGIYIKKNLYGEVFINCFMKEKIGSNYNPPSSSILNDDPQLLSDGWKTLHSITKFIENGHPEATENIKNTAKEINQNFLSTECKFYRFKTDKRNEFIHKGDSLKKEDLDEILFTFTLFEETKKVAPDFSKDDFNSPYINDLLRIMKIIEVDYINWLPIISKLILKELNNYNIWK